MEKGKRNYGGFLKNLDERALSVLALSLFSSWLLAVPFEGQVLYALAESQSFDPHAMVFSSVAAHFAGLILCGFFVRTLDTAKKMMQFSFVYCIVGSAALFFENAPLWIAALVSCSFFAGTCIASWGFYFKKYTASNERIRTAAEILIFPNLIIILINTAANYRPYLGLAIAMLFLCISLFLSFLLSREAEAGADSSKRNQAPETKIVKPLAFLCVFIVIITIDSGLMYQVINPAFSHLDWLVCWYWTVPYIAALYIMKKLPRKTNRTYILYVAIAMIGLSFIGFMQLDRSAISYLFINSLMMGAFGIYDLFWWSILGEMLDFTDNPAKIFGIGLSANVFGVLLGGLAGNMMNYPTFGNNDPFMLALSIVCVTLVILPPLHKRLSALLKNHEYLIGNLETPSIIQNDEGKVLAVFNKLSEREREIAALLLKGKTYKMIADELYLSENTIKTHIKKIYSKFHVKNRSELLRTIIETDRGAKNSKAEL